MELTALVTDWLSSSVMSDRLTSLLEVAIAVNFASGVYDKQSEKAANEWSAKLWSVVNNELSVENFKEELSSLGISMAELLSNKEVIVERLQGTEEKLISFASNFPTQKLVLGLIAIFLLFVASFADFGVPRGVAILVLGHLVLQPILLSRSKLGVIRMLRKRILAP